MYVELGAYQHHVFMDWRLVDDERWRDIYVALNGAGVESMQGKWEETFGEKEEEVVEEVKVKKPANEKENLESKKQAVGKTKTSKKAESKQVMKKSVIPAAKSREEVCHTKKYRNTINSNQGCVVPYKDWLTLFAEWYD